jgi:hypothetical protein
MIEIRFKDRVKEYADIIERIEKLEISEEEMITRLKAKLRFFDGTVLYVREVWLNENVDSYSYYWLRSDETVIIGWDNAPHHLRISSFPHHKHIGDRIEISSERNLGEVLGSIRAFFG